MFSGLVSEAAELLPTYTIRSGPREQVFDVALDEAGERLADGRVAIRGITRVSKPVRLGSRVPVLYPRGAARTRYNRRLASTRVILRLGPGQGGTPERIAATMGWRYVGLHRGLPEFPMFETPTPADALSAPGRLGGDPAVLEVMPQLARLHQKRLIPNDALFSTQWHLRNTGQGAGLAGIDVKVINAWDTLLGSGIRIGIVDDGLQTSHPDLLLNMDANVGVSGTNHHDWNDSTPHDPNPSLAADFHGTSCAGVAAARGNNSIGVSGAAPQATLVGLRLIAEEVTDGDEAEAFAWKSEVIQIKSNSWGPNDDGLTLEAPGPLAEAALADAATNGRGGLGTLFFWAGGNGGNGDNSNFDGYANNIHVIAIGAIGNNGVRASYSEQGANIAVTAPSDGASLDIVTTDLVGNNGYNTNFSAGEPADRNYTDSFGGTSSACPLAAGCAALVLQANANLSARDVKEILIRSATKVDATEADWANNGAGIPFNHKYGAGLINTEAAIALAQTWTPLAAVRSFDFPASSLPIGIPDNSTTGVTRTFSAPAGIRIEHAAVRLSITHPRRGQIAVTLTAPSGMVSRLAVTRSSDANANFTDWTMTSVRHWGEESGGTWTLKVTDTVSGNSGSLTAATLVLTGTGNAAPVVTAATVTPRAVAFFDDSLGVSDVVASDPESDTIALAYQWQSSTDGSTYSEIAGATAATFIPGAALTGQLVRCRVTPSDFSHNGVAFFTEPVAMDRRPVLLAQQGVGYAYDADVYLPPSAGTPTRSVIIHEFSQGAVSGNKEWVELLVINPSDLRGATLSDRGALYTTFASTSLWSALAPGTLIVIYNASDRDSLLPADDLDPSDGILILPHNHASAFQPGSWAGLSNSGIESLVLKNALGTVLDGVSFNGDTVYQPALGLVGSIKAGHFLSNTDAQADLSAQWSIIAATSATPANGNGTANVQWIAALRSGAFGPALYRFSASGSVPGLVIDSASGVVSGMPTAPGLYTLGIERYRGTVQLSTRAYPLLVLDAAGNGTIPSGSVFSMLGDMAIPGSLVINGQWDTGGHLLSVGGTLAISGSVVNTTGTVIYSMRTGATIPGQTLLAQDAGNDAADPDQDGLSNLEEYVRGTDPMVPEALRPTGISSSLPLSLTFTTPAGIGNVFTTVETSGDLIEWGTGQGFTQTLFDQTNGVTRTVTVRDAGTGSARFIRLRVHR